MWCEKVNIGAIFNNLCGVGLGFLSRIVSFFSFLHNCTVRVDDTDRHVTAKKKKIKKKKNVIFLNCVAREKVQMLNLHISK